jgi:hypothetical protein
MEVMLRNFNKQFMETNLEKFYLCGILTEF